MVAVAVVAGQCINALVTTLVQLHLCALIHITMKRLIRLVCTVRHLIANQLIIDALSIRACELSRFTGAVCLFRTTHLVRLVTAVILAITSVHIANTLEVLAGELRRRASLVLVIAELTLVSAVTTVVIVVAKPSLQKNTFNLSRG